MHALLCVGCVVFLLSPALNKYYHVASHVGCILTTLLLKQSVNPVRHHEDIVKLFSSLSEVDPYRHGYYTDLCKHTT